MVCTSTEAKLWIISINHKSKDTAGEGFFRRGGRKKSDEEKQLDCASLGVMLWGDFDCRVWLSAVIPV